jgi:hypothetical protein
MNIAVTGRGDAGPVAAVRGQAGRQRAGHGQVGTGR